MKIYIASDHGGFDLKEKLKKGLQNTEYQLIDLGPSELNPDDDYPDYAFKVAEAVAQDGINEDDFVHASLGILICRSGNGMSVAANKVKGAYATLCFSPHHAEMARRDDNANILALDADYEGENPTDIVRMFISTNFAGKETRHGRRFGKVLEYEMKGGSEVGSRE